MRAIPRLTVPLVIGIALALPLAAGGSESSDDAAVTELDRQPSLGFDSGGSR